MLYCIGWVGRVGDVTFLELVPARANLGRSWKGRRRNRASAACSACCQALSPPPKTIAPHQACQKGGRIGATASNVPRAPPLKVEPRKTRLFRQNRCFFPRGPQSKPRCREAQKASYLVKIGRFLALPASASSAHAINNIDPIWTM